MKYTNMLGLSLSQALFLAYDDYDGPDTEDKYTMSVTGLLSSVRQIVLSRRLPDGLVKEISTLYHSRSGQAYHAAMERVWTDKLQETLTNLGIPKGLRNKIKVNPTKEELTEDCIPIYTEQRNSIKLGKWTVSGKFDLVENGKLIDHKQTSIYTYINQTKLEDYQLQGSIYRLINPDIVTEDFMEIHYDFGKSWDANRAKRDKDYPQFYLHSQKIPLIDLETTKRLVVQKLDNIDKYLELPEEQLPLCTDKELWRTEPVYKYFSNPNNKTSTKNFTDYNEAMLYKMQKNKGVVITVPGEVKYCTMCPAFNLCSQKDAYIASGELKLT